MDVSHVSVDLCLSVDFIAFYRSFEFLCINFESVCGHIGHLCIYFVSFYCPVLYLFKSLCGCLMSLLSFCVSYLFEITTKLTLFLLLNKPLIVFTNISGIHFCHFNYKILMWSYIPTDNSEAKSNSLEALEYIITQLMAWVMHPKCLLSMRTLTLLNREAQGWWISQIWKCLADLCQDKTIMNNKVIQI